MHLKRCTFDHFPSLIPEDVANRRQKTQYPGRCEKSCRESNVSVIEQIGQS
jgi:hypothetical protein